MTREGVHTLGQKAAEVVNHPLHFLFLLSLGGCSTSLQVATWESLNGPEAQQVSALLVDSRNPSILYSCLTTGQVFKSTDRGESWTGGSIIISDTIHTLVQHPDEGETIFAGTDRGLFKSTNSGADWIALEVFSDLETQPVCRAITIDPWIPLQIYIGMDNYGLARSSDGGKTWNLCNSGLPPAQLVKSHVFNIDVHPARPDYLCATISSIGVVKSTDAGNSWVSLTETFKAGGTLATRVIFHPSDPNVICFGTARGDIYKTEDGGASWKLTRQGSGGAPVQSFAIDPKNPEVVYAGTDIGVLVSHDFGTGWREFTDGLPHIATTVIVSPDSAGMCVYAFGQGIGIQRSTDDGATWEKADRNLGKSSVFQVTTSQIGDVVYAGVGKGVYRFGQDTGWVSVSNGLPGSTLTSLAVSGSSDSILYASTLTGIFSTTDKGEHWQRLGGMMHGTAAYFFAAHPSITNRLFCTTETGLMISTDHGMSWKPTRPHVIDYEIQAMTFHASNAGIIGAATSNKAAVTTSDGGLTWEQTRYGIKENNVLCITFHPEDQKTFFAWTADGNGYHSTNSGLEWSSHSPPWKSGDDIRIAVDHFKPWSVIALINRKQIFYSQTGGDHWVELPASEFPAELLSLHWNQNAAVLYAGSHDSGVFRVPLRRSIEKAIR